MGTWQPQVVDIATSDTHNELVAATNVGNADVGVEPQFVELEHVTEAQFPVRGWSKNDQQAVLGSRFAHTLAGEPSNL